MTNVSTPVSKADLRQHFRRLRRAIPDDQRAAAAEAVAARLLALPELADPATPVFTYLAVGAELDTRPLIARLLARRTPVFLPRVEADALVHAPITDLDHLEPGPHHTLQPPANPTPHIEHPTPPVTLLPALALTPAGQRLGQGGGYYDRYLAHHPDTFPVALVYDIQLTDHLPTDPHDQPVRLILTPTRTLRPKPGD